MRSWIPRVRVRLERDGNMNVPVGRIATPEAVAATMTAILQDSPKEEFWVLCVGTRNYMNAGCQVSVGTLGASLVHPREVFSIALLHQTTSIIICHNHPSGETTPSLEDTSLTRRLASAGKLMGITLMDHVIVGDNPHAFYSYESQNPDALNGIQGLT